MDSFFTKRNPTESNAYKKEIDWTPIKVDWKVTQ